MKIMTEIMEPLSDSIFLMDYHNRTNPELMTALLAEAVPVVKEIKFRYENVSKGFCRSFLPLNQMSSNQHGTHQAMLMGLAGDYTGGLALASFIFGEPILGIHEVLPDKGMSLWLVGADMKYLLPSTEDLFIEATIPEDYIASYHTRYLKGGTLFVKVNVSFFNCIKEKVAKGIFTYYCRKKTSLKAPEAGEKANVMYHHITKTSAKLVAWLRGMEKYRSTPLFIDEYAAMAAGKQGKVIGEKFSRDLPELQNLVAARTYHLDNIIKENNQQYRQVVFLGAGFDFRMYRMPECFEHLKCFQLDLPEMLIERNKVKEQLDQLPVIEEVDIPCNFITESILLNLTNSGFDLELSTLFIFEGCSMYFSLAENCVIFSQLQELLKSNRQSRLWMDAVDARILNDELKSPSVHQFLKNMARLGEPFVYGVDNKNDIFSIYGLQAEININAAFYFPTEKSDVYKLYSFYLLKYNSMNPGS